MTDTANAADRFGVPAIISYAIVGLFMLVMLGVFGLIVANVQLEPAMLGVLGGLIGATTAALSAVTAYWIGSSNGEKRANASMAQLAGAGAPPPADPNAQEKKL